LWFVVGQAASVNQIPKKETFFKDNWRIGKMSLCGCGCGG
jgi:hypothetical protein